MADYRWILYQTIDEGSIAIITLNRPKQRNAQNRGLLVELDAAFLEAEADDDVKVVILRAAGTTFSSGHDMGSSDDRAEREVGGEGSHPTYSVNGGTRGGIERMWRQEWHYFLTNTRRWRDLQKITIASVHGQVYSAGLMLMWACDLIVADETAEFADVVGTRLGMHGVEYFAHPWEFGARRAKELLLTGDSLDAHAAYDMGMLSRVFPEGTLEDNTIDFARRVAQLPTFAALMIKQSVNQAQDIQGFYAAMSSTLPVHELNHAHWAITNNDPNSFSRYPKGQYKAAAPLLRRAKDAPAGEPSA